MTTTNAPLIGIPCRHDTSARYQSVINAQQESYLEAIVQAGGIPFLIPLNLAPPAWRRLYDLAQGILLIIPFIMASSGILKYW